MEGSARERVSLVNHVIVIEPKPTFVLTLSLMNRLERIPRREIFSHE